MSCAGDWVAGWKTPRGGLCFQPPAVPWHRNRTEFSTMSDSVLTTNQQIESLWALGGLTWRELARSVWGGVNRNDLLNRAYELAYNFLLAVFPMLLFLLGVLGMLASEGSRLRSDLFYYLQLALPPAA